MKTHTAASLLKIRQRNGWTVAQLAKALGVPFETVANWSRSKSKPPALLHLLLVQKGIVK